MKTVSCVVIFLLFCIAKFMVFRPYLGVDSALSPLRNNHESLAYVTLLGEGKTKEEWAQDPEGKTDPYTTGAMMLAYQLLHAPETRTQRSIPFIVLASEEIPQQRRDRLAAMGATVIPIEVLGPTEWMTKQGKIEGRFKFMFTKLRAWDVLKKFSRVVFMDGDTVLMKPLDAVFDDPASQFQSTSLENLPPDEALPPSNYVLGSMPETSGSHPTPPTLENGGFTDPEYFNAGFFVFSPNPMLFQYYASIMDATNRFDPKYAEQNLLNYAHRRNGTAPWQQFQGHWNVRFPMVDDYQEGLIASFHDKWWAPEGYGGHVIRPYYEKIKDETEAFYWSRVSMVGGSQNPKNDPAQDQR
ncbi:MAG: hypothetical protein Q9160_001751 [Pyrenula sp. 1 TL-2023]